MIDTLARVTATSLALLTGSAAAQGQEDALPMPLAAVVLAPQAEPGPPGAAEAEIRIDAAEPLTLPELAVRIAAAGGHAVEIEERPSRTGEQASLPAVTPRRVTWSGPLAGLLDLAAAAYRYRWEWRGEAVVFYRYWDAEFASSTEPGPEARQVRWVIDIAEEPTLRAVLDRWAGEAGWSLAWKAPHDYRLGADAVIEGPFLSAVDSLLADPATASTLTATAYRANRQLVIEEAQ